MTTANILVVEDDKIIAKGIEKRLKGMGYAAAGLASTGEEAIQKAVDNRPDLILMDICLGGGMDGVAATELIRKRVDVPVVYLTAYSDPATLERAKITEPFGYVLKPYEDRDLQTAIEIGLYKHKADRRLRENERWLAATLASIGDGIIATNEQGLVRFMNALAEQLTGWTQTDALGRDVQEVFNVVEAKSRQPVTNPALDALKKGERIGLAPNTILIGKAGTELPIDDSAAPIREVNDRMVGSVLVFRDITERRRLEEHLRQAQKMEAIGYLAGGIAHEFNNIMTIIMGFSDVLLTSDRIATPDQRPLRAIHDAGKRAASLTQQIMAFSGKQMLMPCVLNLNSVVRDMDAMVKQLLGPNIEFVTNPAPDLGLVRADPTQLGQVLLNLAANARDGLPNGGQLIVATSNAELDEETARQHLDVKSGRYVLLSIGDTGPGMTKDVLAHVFEPFFTTKGLGQGTGLGLATAYGIVKQSGGHIEVSSKLGEGTTFRVYLPLFEEPAQSPDRQETAATAKGQETILLVEGEENLREMTSMILTQSGYNVLDASTSLEGMAVAKEYQGPIHVLLADLEMPKLSGPEMAQRLTAIKPGLRVLFMSGYTEDMILRHGFEAVSASILPKPFGLSDLTKKVRDVLDRP
jgi:PAS domain S-box-containing protein